MWIAPGCTVPQRPKGGSQLRYGNGNGSMIDESIIIITPHTACGVSIPYAACGCIAVAVAVAVHAVLLFVVVCYVALFFSFLVFFYIQHLHLKHLTPYMLHAHACTPQIAIVHLHLHCAVLLCAAGCAALLLLLR